MAKRGRKPKIQKEEELYKKEPFKFDGDIAKDFRKKDIPPANKTDLEYRQIKICNDRIGNVLMLFVNDNEDKHYVKINGSDYKFVSKDTVKEITEKGDKYYDLRGIV